ncbi:hypothetical protein CYMTET_27190 [Cymbomonas tetramitiformis]|uniref:Uncharacterized protein n=1 Tax=Cymbomonas tetramitiformis TaxID=36881 RepID=A0AAE0FQJ6_9CHLO|nr:hypothetical protein CYMTET_27190 [Cymbomonas tetramitiformis]
MCAVGLGNEMDDTAWCQRTNCAGATGVYLKPPAVFGNVEAAGLDARTEYDASYKGHPVGEEPWEAAAAAPTHEAAWAAAMVVEAAPPSQNVAREGAGEGPGKTCGGTPTREGRRGGNNARRHRGGTPEEAVYVVAHRRERGGADNAGGAGEEREGAATGDRRGEGGGGGSNAGGTRGEEPAAAAPARRRGGGAGVPGDRGGTAGRQQWRSRWWHYLRGNGGEEREEAGRSGEAAQAATDQANKTLREEWKREAAARREREEQEAAVAAGGSEGGGGEKEAAGEAAGGQQDVPGKEAAAGPTHPGLHYPEDWAMQLEYMGVFVAHLADPVKPEALNEEFHNGYLTKNVVRNLMSFYDKGVKIFRMIVDVEAKIGLMIPLEALGGEVIDKLEEVTKKPLEVRPGPMARAALITHSGAEAHAMRIDQGEYGVLAVFTDEHQLVVYPGSHKAKGTSAKAVAGQAAPATARAVKAAPAKQAATVGFGGYEEGGIVTWLHLQQVSSIYTA